MKKHFAVSLRMKTRVLLASFIASFMTPTATAAIAIDQSPLFVQQALPPNIVLMLDDSLSMTLSIMPDEDYLHDKSDKGKRNSAVNGVYYNPATTYTPPPKADGTFYKDNATENFPDKVLYDPVGGDEKQVDITGTTYGKGRDDARNTSSSFNFYERLSCGNNCSINAFAYTDSEDNKTHYVASDCRDTSNCVEATDTSGAAAPDGIAAGKNIANWYSYYSTRLKLAKSGLLTAFSTLDPTIRLGFGSINGQNNNNLPAPTVSYNNTKIASVQAFETQKSKFWKWVSTAGANSTTPLRTALDAVGQYYQSAQPWQTSNEDKTELACRQSFTILTTDGFWNDTTRLNVGNADGEKGTKISGPSNQPYTYSPTPPFSDGNSDTLADVAMKYWKSDLRTNTNNEVPTSPEDPAFWQHMTTFTLGLGFTPVDSKGTLSINDDIPLPIDDIFNWAKGGAAINNFQWPRPSSDNLGSINNIADLAHAAVNGHGGFYSATSPEAFTNGIKDALQRASERNGTGASLAANSTKLETGTVTYQALYRTAVWTGDLIAYDINPNTGVISDQPNWSAASGIPAAAARTIITYNKDASGASKFVSFKEPSDLSSAQKAALGSNETSQKNIINYLRGDDSLEEKNIGGTYRNRSTALGDIVDSQPVYVGTPDPNLFYGKTFNGSDQYNAGLDENNEGFASAQASRMPTIWVAANDGMLHGFNARTGAEIYAYLPGAVIVGDQSSQSTRLSNLANANYGSPAQPHQHFNDGETTVADAFFNNSWHTVLVGTTGRGPARAIYAIDITNPEAPQPLWERSAGDGQENSQYIGQIIGKPVIAQTANGTWSVLVGNGYNSTSGIAALLQFAISGGALTIHTTDATTDNGLASPAVWMADTTNGISTDAYAGDLKGNVWSFKLSSSGNNGNHGNNNKTDAATPLFTATDANGHAQPITAGMLIGKDPKTQYVWLFFGTGRYLAQSELTDKSTQSWYGIIVQAGDNPELVANLENGRSAALVQRLVIGEVAATSDRLAARAVSTPDDDGMTGKSGWYIDLTSPTAGAQGERMVTPNQFQGALLIGTTRVPESFDPCNPSGNGWIMAIDPFTGRGSGSAFFDLNDDGKFDNDTIPVDGKTYAAAGIGFSAVSNNPIFVGNVMEISFDNAKRRSVQTAGTVGLIQRLSWRELIAK